jgi:tetratricopeptide (TPR) repeat protein
LLDLPGNREVFQRLVQQLSTPLGVVPFVGAGLSIPCGMPGWAEFLTSSATAEARPRVVIELERAAFEEAAQLVAESLGTRAFHDRLETVFHVLEGPPSGPVLRLPAITRGPVLTTNIDRVLERVFENAGRPFAECVWGAKPDMLGRALHSDSRYLIKIHGDALDRSDRILTLDEYEQHYGGRQASEIDLSLPLPQVLEQAFASRTLLFVGCSLGADRTVAQLRRVARRAGTPTHYAICEAPAVPDRASARARFLSEHNIRPLWFQASEYGAVDVYLAELARSMTGAPTFSTANRSARVSPPPRYQDEATRALAENLDRARARRKELADAGEPTREVDDEILGLRRTLREGGQLKAGDALREGRFLLLERLKRGGFGWVWRAFDREREELVAIKVMHSEFAVDSVRRDRFYRGARAMAELAHPHVVRIREACSEDGGYHYFVMDLLSGDLEQAVLAGQPTLARIVSTILGVGSALAAAHARGIVHRDVKPANVLLDAEGEPKLSDFDLVRAGDTTGGTRSGALGSFPYLAPECLLHADAADARADVYGLAMTAIFALHGASLPLEVYRNGSAFVDGLACTISIKSVLKRAISWEAAGRPADAALFCKELEHALTEDSAGAAGRARVALFGDEAVSEERLDEIILSYLKDNADEGADANSVATPPVPQEDLVQRLVQNPHDTDAITLAHQAGQSDARGYALLLEMVGKATADPVFACHWLTEAANVWSTTLGDLHSAAGALMLAIDRDPRNSTPAERLAELYRESGEKRALVALLERRIKLLAPVAHADPELRPYIMAMHEELGTLWAEPPLDQPVKAMANYRRAIELDSSNQYAIYQLRELLKSAEEWTEALPFFELERRLVSDPERQVALYLDEADVRHKAGDLKGAAQALRSARSIEGGHDATLKQLLASHVLERAQANESVTPEERTEAAQLFIDLAEAYPGEHGLSYSICALELQTANDRAVQLAMYYAEQLERENEAAAGASAYLEHNPKGPLSEEAREFVERVSGAGRSATAPERSGIGRGGTSFETLERESTAEAPANTAHTAASGKHASVLDTDDFGAGEASLRSFLALSRTQRSVREPVAMQRWVRRRVELAAVLLVLSLVLAASYALFPALFPTSADQKLRIEAPSRAQSALVAPPSVPAPSDVSVKEIPTLPASPSPVPSTNPAVHAKTPGQSAKSQRVLSDDSFARGQKLYDQGKYAEAQALFEKAQRVAPNAVNEYAIAVSLDLQGKSREALQAYRRFLANPDAATTRDASVATATTRVHDLAQRTTARGP